ncbi:hypothetical protein DFR52_101491 [Hoeflea marina]|uniref:CorA-like Mg2+ transporter protein n=1 Tax=Hoeflea marina TaxID=274592 RepID=A0A317PQQ6_9HYPH|nr:hypothetical protein [Hoeflea marina]PWW03803.1 hypothetical protein DFR52_101491 [Hoeflea marina]
MKSGDIPVRVFREILLFPLRLDHHADKPLLNDHLAGLDGKIWKPLGDPKTIGRSRIAAESDRAYESDADHKRRNDYAELAYFHPYVQRFLYEEASAGRGPLLTTYAREGIDRLVVTAGYGFGGIPWTATASAHSFSLELLVERIHCHHVREPGLLIFSVELVADQNADVRRFGEDGGLIDDARGLSLAEVLVVKDCLRRVFPPYFEKLGTPGRTGGGGAVAWNRALFPSSVELAPAGSQEGQIFALDVATANAMADQMLMPERLHPVAPWWREVFKGFNIDGNALGPQLFQTGDERMQSLSFVAVGEAAAVERPDLVRLCFADGPGNGYPYDPAFLAEFEKDHCYDRFWDQGTRYMFSSYSTTLLVQTLGGDFFPLQVLQEHLRRHYFRLQLMVQINKTGLLAFSSWLSAAMRLHGSLRSSRYRRQVNDLRRGFLEFSQISWFSNVSNQEQARELYAAMMRHSGNPDLYQEVARELEQARNELAEIETEKQSEAGAGLNVIALVASAVGLFLTYAQVAGGVFAAGGAAADWFHSVLGGVFMVAGVAAFYVTRQFYEGKWKPRRGDGLPVKARIRDLRRPAYLLSIGAVAAGAVILVWQGLARLWPG